MKLRIKGNSLRIRLSQTEVKSLCSGLTLQDKTSFLKSDLRYSVKPTTGNSLNADFENEKITMYVPEILLKDWSGNETVGFEGDMKINDSTSLHLLLEKDFKCLDQATEDQADFYDNPNKACE
jgi:hypothetical protein